MISGSRRPRAVDASSLYKRFTYDSTSSALRTPHFNKSLNSYDTLVTYWPRGHGRPSPLCTRGIGCKYAMADQFPYFVERGEQWPLGQMVIGHHCVSTAYFLRNDLVSQFATCIFQFYILRETSNVWMYSLAAVCMVVACIGGFWGSMGAQKIQNLATPRSLSPPQAKILDPPMVTCMNLSQESTPRGWYSVSKADLIHMHDP